METWGFVLVVAAGILNGSFALPLRRTTRWAWENTWLVYSVAGMVVVNWIVALWTVPSILDVYTRAGWGIVSLVFLFGVTWGTANLLFGIGIARIGMSLTFAICIGMSTALGSLIPMAARPEVFRTPRGMAVVLGVACILLGVALCALAGRRKEARSLQGTAAGRDAAGPHARGPLIAGLLIVILAGILDPTLNFAFNFGEEIKEEAKASGAWEGAAPNAVWTLALLGSFLVNAVYCGILLARNSTWRRYGAKGSGGHWVLAGLMGVVWMLSIVLYGIGASLLGELGGSAGWALFYCSIILFSSLWGMLAGEWKGAGNGPLGTMALGLFLLLAAIAVLGYGNTLPMD